MKLGTLKSGTSRDGDLIVVSKDNSRAIRASFIAPSLREALENWSATEPRLRELSAQLNSGTLPTAVGGTNMFQLTPEFLHSNPLHSPLPRSFQWADGSAYIHHIKLVRMSRNAPLPETLEKVPLMYQGGSDAYLAPNDDIPQVDFAHGTDFEGEIGVITDDVPMGVTPEVALQHICLIVMINDVSLRGLIPEELAQGFGFFQSKPASAFAPFALTPDELGSAWSGGRVHLPLHVEYNGEFFGKANAGAMHFDFGQLIAHAARTRALTAGTIIGSGTVSNEDVRVGSSCLAEKRMLEKIHDGVIKTPFMKVGDSVKLEMFDNDGHNLFGTIQQKVVKYTPPV